MFRKPTAFCRNFKGEIVPLILKSKKLIEEINEIDQ